MDSVRDTDHPQPKAEPRYVPAGFSDEDEDDSDPDMDYYSSAPGSKTPQNPTPIFNPPSVSTALAFEEDEWADTTTVTSAVAKISPGSTEPAPAASWQSSLANQSESHPMEPATATVKPARSNTPRGKQIIPEIPGIERNRAIGVSKAINTAWRTAKIQNLDLVASGISRMLTKEFTAAINPYASALNLMAYAADFFVCRYNARGLALEIMQEFKKWLLLDSGGLSNYEKRYLHPELQKIAFTIISMQWNSTLVKLAYELYRLTWIRSELIQPIEEFCKEKNYRNACIAATYLSLYDEFDIHKFVIPALMQDREVIVTDYLMASKKRQEEVIAFFDAVFGDPSPTGSLANYITAHKIDQVKIRLESKTLSKLLDRLRTKFGMDLMNCPNSGRRKRVGALRYLMHRKFVQMEQMSEEAFQEMIDVTVENEESLIEEGLTLLRSNYDLIGAAKFALRHAFPLHKIPYDVRVEMHRINPNVVELPIEEKPNLQAWDEDWDFDETSTAAAVQQNASEANAPLMVKSGRSLTPSLKNSAVPLSQTAQVSLNAKRTPTQTFSVSPVPSTGFDDRKDIFYKCLIPTRDIYLYSTPEDVDTFIQHMKAAEISGDRDGYVITGIDCEWTPTPGKTGVALLQIATLEHVFLIDTFMLKKNFPTGSHWNRLRLHYFMNEKILKLGFGLHNDLKNLTTTVPAWSKLKSELKSVVDLETLVKLLLEKSPSFTTFKSGGLSELVKAVTGFPLSKSEQMSNWEIRPLREAKVIYAATDAYCLVDLLEQFKNQGQELGINVEEIIEKLAASKK